MAQCTAHTKSHGGRCKQPSIPGGHVCRYHGGSAPQVRSKAAMRLATLVDPAISKYAILFKNPKKKPDGLELRAILDVLDRNNLKGDNLIRLQNPDAGHATPSGLTAEQLAVIDTLEPDELEILIRVIGVITNPESDRSGPVSGPARLTS